MLLAAVVFGGCAARIHTPFVPGHEPPWPLLVKAAVSEFDYVDNLPHPRYGIVAEGAAYWDGSLAFPSVGENGQEDNLVSARYYRGRRPGAKPLVVVLASTPTRRTPSPLA